MSHWELRVLHRGTFSQLAANSKQKISQVLDLNDVQRLEGGFHVRVCIPLRSRDIQSRISNFRFILVPFHNEIACIGTDGDKKQFTFLNVHGSPGCIKNLPSTVNHLFSICKFHSVISQYAEPAAKESKSKTKTHATNGNQSGKPSRQAQHSPRWLILDDRKNQEASPKAKTGKRQTNQKPTEILPTRTNKNVSLIEKFLRIFQQLIEFRNGSSQRFYEKAVNSLDDGL
jgi:hypothetical protein